MDWSLWVQLENSMKMEALIMDAREPKSQFQNQAFHRPAVRCQRPSLWWVLMAPGGVSVLGT